MSRRDLRGDQRGMTLIELMLALTILAISGALVSGALATGLRSWQSGVHSGREDLVARIVLERIAAQLRAAIAAPARRNGADAVAFDAGEDRLRFVTLAANGSAPVQVSYGLGGDGAAPHLVYREYPWPDKEFFGAGSARREEDIVEVTAFAVTVLKRSGPDDTDDAEPQQEWSPQDRELPAIVVVEIALGAEGRNEPRQARITVPIPTQRVAR